ncbi:MAG: DNA gyrase subunit A [Patescibacteria group bacterium]
MADNDKDNTIDVNIGTVEHRSISDEMAESYLDYAMSVIVARALPDVRDGLKPVHRRVLYAMHQMGLTSRSKQTKCAKIVGEVLGKYHPHGDQAAYATLARMAQDFSMRYPLVDGQGNFGSIDGDSPAAMRYTEARIAALTEDLVADIEKETVDFAPNYDNSEIEPKYLPAKVPHLLLNGAIGIAVGMATNILPHNLREVCEGTKALIDNPDLTLDELMEHIPGPDFPTGAVIYNKADIQMAYATGRGRIVMRSVANIEERKSGGFQIVVSEIPYQVNKADLVTKIAQLVKDKRIEGISDLRDESDRKDLVRIVIELKSTAYPKKILNQLFEMTSMQTVFHVNMLALQNGIQPIVFTLKDALQAFLDHRVLVVRRRTAYDLKKAEHRAHILEGLKIALDRIDEVITTIRSSKNREIAHTALMDKFSLTDIQSSAILEMRLAALSGLERQKVQDELEEKLKLIQTLKEILASNERIQGVIKTELDEMIEKYGDERRTKIVKSALGEFTAEDLIPNEQVVITLTDGNYIKRVPTSTYKTQHRGGKGIVGMTTKDEDSVTELRVADTHDDILFFTSKGRLFRSKVYELPSASRQAKGTPIVNLIQLGQDEHVSTLITSKPVDIGADHYFFMGTKRGVVKKTRIDAYQNVRATGIIAMKLDQEDELKWVRITSGSDQLLIVSRLGQAIRFHETDVRPMGRSAAGVRGMKLRASDEVIALNTVKDPNNELVTVSTHGLGKRTKIGLFHIQRRGGIGLRAARVTDRTGHLVSTQLVEDETGDVVMISEQGQTIRLPLKSVKRLGRDTQGVTLMRLSSKGDKVASMTVFTHQEDEAPELVEQS